VYKLPKTPKIFKSEFSVFVDKIPSPCEVLHGKLKREDWALMLHITL
jgi:hypothetical protein